MSQRFQKNISSRAKDINILVICRHTHRTTKPWTDMNKCRAVSTSLVWLKNDFDNIIAHYSVVILFLGKHIPDRLCFDFPLSSAQKTMISNVVVDGF